MKKRILCLGSAALDNIYGVEKIPTGSAKVLAREFVQVGAGMAASAATAIVRLGGSAEFYGRIGNDPAGLIFLSDMRREGVWANGVRVVGGHQTQVSAIVVTPDCERVLYTYKDRHMPADPSWLPFDQIRKGYYDGCLVDVRWPEGAGAVLQAAKEAGVIGMLDADTAPNEDLEKLVPLASHVVFSKQALLAYTGNGLVAEALHIVSTDVNGFVGATIGWEGFLWMQDGGIHRVPSLQVQVVDTLAAGDVFHGAFILALVEGQPIRHAAHFACVAASLKCRTFGGRLGAPYREEVEQTLETF